MKLAILIILISIFVPGIQVRAQSNEIYGNNSSHAKRIFSRGVNFYIEEYGKGDPVILLHGNGGNISSFTSVIPLLEKQFRVIAIDSRAHGKSIDNGDSLSFEMMADDVSAIIDSLKFKKVFLIGWSDGGIVGIEMALRHPEQLRKIAVTGANLWPDSTALEPAVWLESVQYFLSNQAKKRTTPKEKNDWKIFLLDYYQPNITLKEISQITTPSLIIAGDHDLIRIGHTVQIFQNIPQAGLWIVPFSGHGTLIEHPKEFCEAITSFFYRK
ncbi:MAG: alpha/beta hydrolase [Chitinophagaceae bacterium]|nr:alpha/beta hydrolase [Bacteroidota bacterium]MCC6257209.1 alpha/beta hydrolase [Chitinophagaceae bacterium]MCW5915858.1 alpha/beta hydrolase [Ferruginibacter sp.]